MAKKIDFELNNLRKAFPENFTEDGIQVIPMKRWLYLYDIEKL